MNDAPLTLKQAIRRRVRSEEARLLRHPETSTWVAFHRRGLPPAETAALEQHLGACRQCTELLLDFEAFLQAEEGTDLEEADEVWQALRVVAPKAGSGPEAECTSENDGDPGSAVVLPLARPARPDGGWRGLSRGRLAASLGWVVALGLLAYQLGPWQSRREPRVNVPLADLRAEGTARGGGEPGAAFRLPAEAEWVLLVLNPEGPLAAESYGARIVSAVGRVKWHSGRLAPTAEQVFTIELPRGFLPPGRYRLELFGREGDTETSLGVFPLEVARP